MKYATRVLRRALVFAAILFIGSATQSLASGVVPFTIEAGQIIVRIKIKKDVSVDAAVVTGSPYSYLLPEVITRLKMQVKYTNDGPVTGRNDKILFFTELPDVIIGEEKPVSLYMANGTGGMVGTSLVALSKKLGREISLSLGADAFRNKIVQFDFKQKVIRYLDAPPIDYKDTSATKAGVRSVHRMSATFDVFYGGRVTLPIISDVMVDGAKLSSILDTGAAYPLLLSASAGKQLSLPVPEKDKGMEAKLATLKFGVAEFSNVPGLVLGKDTLPFDKDPSYTAVIGIAVIQNLLVTFDWTKGMLVIEK